MLFQLFWSLLPARQPEIWNDGRGNRCCGGGGIFGRCDRADAHDRTKRRFLPAVLARLGVRCRGIDRPDADLRMPPPVLLGYRHSGWIGVGAIALAVASFNGSMPYPSWNAVFPSSARRWLFFLELRDQQLLSPALWDCRPSWRSALSPTAGIFGIGRYCHSSGWRGWTRPIYSLTPLAVAFWDSRWPAFPTAISRSRSGAGANSRRISDIRGGSCLERLSASLFCAVLGGSSALAGYQSINSFVASRYGVEGKGTLDNGCDSKSGFAPSCFEGAEGILIGDSHATVIYGTFAKQFAALHTRLISMARGGCAPFLLSKPQRRPDRRDDCARLIAPFERILARRDPVAFAIITGTWSNADATLVSELITEFDRNTRILLIGPVPMFEKPGLACVVLSDRYGHDRNACVRPRDQVEGMEALAISILKTMSDRFPNVRFINPTDVFCDQTVCRSFKGDEVLYKDEHHLSPAGADRVFDAFWSDFAWAAGKSN